MRFLKDNAMQVGGLLTYVVGFVLTFTHLSTLQTAQLATAPSAVVQFLVGMVLKRNGNGKGSPPLASGTSVHN